jgi:hypothetical protein
MTRQTYENHRIIPDYSKESIKKIVSHFPSDKQKVALAETKEIVSTLIGNYFVGTVLDGRFQKQVDKFTNQLVNKLATIPENYTTFTNKQKEELKNVVKKLFSPGLKKPERNLPPFPPIISPIDERCEEATRETIKITFPTKKYSSVEEEKIKLKTDEIKDFFLKKIVIEKAYKDSLTFKRRESVDRFKSLLEKIRSLKKELCFFLVQEPFHHDSIFKEEFRNFPIRSLSLVNKPLQGVDDFKQHAPLVFPPEIKGRKKRRYIRALAEIASINIARESLSSSFDSDITLQTVKDLLCELEFVTAELKSNPGWAGVRNFSLLQAVLDLIKTYEEYSGKETTLKNKTIGYGLAGDFYEYLEKSILPFLPLKSALGYIARKACSFHKKTVAKISSK